MSFYWNFEEELQARREGINNHSRRETRSIKLNKIEIGGEKRDVSIRLVETNDKIQAACDLINDRYSWRGYGASHQIPADADHMTFTAEVEDEVVGTITLAVDSQRGLAVDGAFKDEMDRFRAMPGTKVCELTKFAFGSSIQSKELMAALFHIVFVYGHRTYGCTDLFIEVNPRHVRFYEAMLGFERVGPLKTNESVGAPAQLMWLKVAAIRDHINRCAGGADRHNARSLYPFFFSPAEESGIYRRLTRDRVEEPVVVTRPCATDPRHFDADPAVFLDSCHPGNHSASSRRPAPPDHLWANQ
jgi:hypothetical protein